MSFLKRRSKVFALLGVLLGIAILASVLIIIIDGSDNLAERESNTETGNQPSQAGEARSSVGYNLSSASYDNNKRAIGQATKPEGTAFSGDGSKMFVVGSGNNSVHSYDLSTAYDISTASYNQKFDVSGQAGIPTGVTFNADGSKMFVVG
ncbi:MAG: hypothetical protein BRC23_00585, partial [Parcubacteria group bacterium SW_4_49_11]